MCCAGCGNTYKCYKRAHEYIPDLVMFMHCITDCLEYQKLGMFFFDTFFFFFDTFFFFFDTFFFFFDTLFLSIPTF